MTQITIRQLDDLTASPNAEVSFGGEPGFPITVQNPFDAAEEARLAWYFEQWLNFPFTDQVKAQAAAQSVRTYGEALFAQTLGGAAHIATRYRQAVAQGVATLHFQIIGTPTFHALHWEAIWDPDRPRPLTLDAAMIRSGGQPLVHPLHVQPSPTINVLLVTARPHGGRDVGYRTIQRPLIEMLHQTQLPVAVQMVRPGTWRALVDHLRQSRQQHGVGHYQIIHFDLHGAVRSRRQLEGLTGVSPHSYEVRRDDRYARADLASLGEAERATAWLFFEDEKRDDLDAASAEEVAGLLLDYQIPIAILNACQSGQETGDPETSLGSRLLQAGVQTVVAMGYSVTVSAATRLMAALYRQLFQPPHDLLSAISAGRTALHHDKARNALYNQQIRLEDWLLPVVYQPSAATASRLPLRTMSFDEQIAFLQHLGDRYPPPTPEYGFVGRDLDILQIEKRLLQSSEGKRRNLLLIQGMGGAGKSTLLHHLASWWQTTGLVDEVFYFGYDERAHTLVQLLDALARRLLNRTIPAGAAVAREFATFQAMQPKLQATLLAQKLRSEPHLLILDNLESVTGDPLAIPNTLPVAEQQAIRGFLADLLDGQTLVLLGSRGTAAWLQGGSNPPLRAVDSYALPGLDSGAAADLAERILMRQVSDAQRQASYRSSPALRHLLKLLDGSPLALEVVLSNLTRQTPAEILGALVRGDVALDGEMGRQGDREIGGQEDKTRSILQCVAYAHSNLDASAQQLLLCLFPFTGVLWADQLESYTKHLLAQLPNLQSALATLPAVLKAAQEWGLLTAHELPGFLRIQPVLPYFLKTRLAQESAELRQAIETAFRLHYTDLAEVLFGLFEAKDPQERQAARLLSGVEYENLATALQFSLAARVSFFEIYAVLGLYLDSMQDHQRGIELGQSILAQMEHYPPEMRFGSAASSFLRVLGELGRRQTGQKRYAEAEASYQQAATLIDQITNADAQTKAGWKATVYHQLGIVAQAQRAWAQAEQHYQLALAIDIEFNNRHGQASTYHNLGNVAEEHQQWAQAEQHYQHTLALKIEFNDRYSQALTYHQLGNVAYKQRQWAQAEQHYQLALALLIEFNDRYSQALTYHQLGMVAQAQRQWAQAEQHYQHALALKIEFNDRYTQATVYHQLGMLAQAQRQWVQAEQHYQHALALFIEFNDRYTQASTYGQLGLLMQDQERWAEAEQALTQALAIFLEFEDQHYAGVAVDNLRRLYQAHPDETLLQAVATGLGRSVAEVQAQFGLGVPPAPDDEPEPG